MEVKIIVDRGFVGHIVGKQGTSINQIKSETECLVQIIPPHPSPLVAAEEQIIKVGWGAACTVAGEQTVGHEGGLQPCRHTCQTQSFPPGMARAAGVVAQER